MNFKVIIASLLALLTFANCNNDPVVCELGDYIGTYKGSKLGALCINDDSYTFTVSAGAESDEILVDGNVMQFDGCDINSDGTFLGLGEEYEGYLAGDSIVVIQTAGTGIATVGCTWRGLRQ